MIQMKAATEKHASHHINQQALKKRQSSHPNVNILSNQEDINGGRINLIEVRQGSHSRVGRIDPAIELQKRIKT